MTMTTMRKKILFINRQSPYGDCYAQEALDALLMASTFDQDTSVLFLDDGVLQLKAQQNPTPINNKHFSKAFQALPLYGIENIYVDTESLKVRGLQIKDLLLSVTLLNTTEIRQLMSNQDVILNF